ncbi:ABC transporter permease subunit [Nitratireductor aquimarinus]|uniref:ABC transporter permease subunit n=1 Tax=Nitratireductor TaxID=245876 RepID=UPI0019D34467|nr:MULTISPECIES: ABC transporter permease subunit [Nitratireductor]MBN7776621.1 ABC transporter permease subunit [Nitratireductor pacificus]MBN7779488.1 ABC transporter permease subunit [Nitratireductor pacificus]MBN7788295.1 ABC transporter permease subunit [Nitratireductor aquimarinus]MBY6098342.1 ABC transporter permease subunit [Nitratireductor aquimarinus]MCA1261026.1 ABC transporter permease subunit [Nitratireductor aquimarinus]
MSRETRNALLGFLGVVAVLFGFFVTAYGADTARTLGIIANRASLLLVGSNSFDGLSGGFAANIGISLASMAISTVIGVSLGGATTAPDANVRRVAILVVNLMRNSPWLVVLYAMLYLIPFRLTILGQDYWVSPAVKAIIGLSVPVTAYMAEVFRAGIQSVPAGQWESAAALGYRRRTILRRIILPQALPQMLPNIMTTYAMLFIGTSLVVVTGTEDVLSIAQTVIASDGDDYATAVYLFVLLLFFVYCYPIAAASRALETKVRTR